MTDTYQLDQVFADGVLGLWPIDPDHNNPWNINKTGMNVPRGDTAAGAPRDAEPPRNRLSL